MNRAQQFMKMVEDLNKEKTDDLYKVMLEVRDGKEWAQYPLLLHATSVRDAKRQAKQWAVDHLLTNLSRKRVAYVLSPGEWKP
jgi:uncharacterized membrane-anchored protein